MRLRNPTSPSLFGSTKVQATWLSVCWLSQTWWLPRLLLKKPSFGEMTHLCAGCVRMSLSADSVKKVTSMREELWMTDNDEGTPQYPCIGDVIGVHDNYVHQGRTSGRGPGLFLPSQLLDLAILVFGVKTS